MYHSFLIHSSADGPVGEGEGGMFQENSIETYILYRVKHIISPGWMHETSARIWCTGKTQRDRVKGRWEGGSGGGTHVNPWLIHFNVWQNPLQYCKVISLQLIKINEKKKKRKHIQNSYNSIAKANIPIKSGKRILIDKKIYERLTDT